jgi:hypothetical protein
MCSGAGGAEAVDRLRVVTDNRQPALLAAQLADDLDLEGVQVLVLVNEDLLEKSGKLRPQHRVAGERVPVEEEIVVVEHGELPLALAVDAVQTGDLLEVVLTPREMLGHDMGQLPLGVDAAGVEVEQRLLAREPRLPVREAVLLTQELEEIGRVRGVKNPHLLRQAERRRVSADHVVGNRVEGATDDAPARLRRHQRPSASEHLAGRPAGEREQQKPLRRNTTQNVPRDPRTERRRLPRPGPREHEQGAALVRHSGVLLRGSGPQEAAQPLRNLRTCVRSLHRPRTLHVSRRL